MISSPHIGRSKGRAREDSFIQVRTLVLLGALCVSALGLSAAPVPSGKPANYPAWWFSRGVIAPINATNSSPVWPGGYITNDDYGAINEGQLKYIALQGYLDLQANAPTNVWSTVDGTHLTSVIKTLSTPVTNEDDYKAMNLGQLKGTLVPFYNVLQDIGYSSNYPWTGVGADDYSVANAGQLKNVFSFDVGLDTDHNGLPDWWEIKYFGTNGFGTGFNTNSSPDNNGFTLEQDYQGQANPTNYYSQPSSNGPVTVVPNIIPFSGNNQFSPPSSFASLPLVVKIINSNTAVALQHAPVTFTVNQPGGQLYTSTNGGTGAISIPLTTDTNGFAQVYFQQSAASYFTNTISASSGGYSTNFTEASTSGGSTNSVAIISSPSATGIAGTDLNYLIAANTTVTNYSSSTLPPGLTLNSSTGAILGAPTTAGTYHVTVSATGASGTGSTNVTLMVDAAPSVPPVASGLTAWYKADGGITNSGSGVAEWNDQSTNAYNVVPTDVMPTLGQDATSGKPEVIFDGSDDSLSSVETVPVDNVTIVTVAGSTTPSSNYQTQIAVGSLYHGDQGARTFAYDNGNQSFNNAATSVDGGPVPTDSLLHLNTVTFSRPTGASTTGTATFYSQGASASNGPAQSILGSSVDVGLYIGSNAYNPNACWNGGIAEILIYNRVLSQAERQQVEGYLANKYSIYAPGALWIGNYPSSLQTLINQNQWDEAQAIAYLQANIPVVNSASTATALAGSTFSYAITATNSPTYYQALNLPGGLAINTTTGVITGTPTTAGTYAVTLNATNASGTGQLILSLNVQPATPVISSPTTAAGTAGAAFSYTITAGSNATVFGATGLPGTLTVDPATGIISGTPTAAATYTVTLSAKNTSNGKTGYATLTLTIYPQLPVTTGLVAWFNAQVGVQSGANGVTQWNDQTSNQYNVVQSAGANAATLATDANSGNPMLSFNGNQFLNIAQDATLATNDVTIITVSSMATSTDPETSVFVGNAFSNQGRSIYNYSGDQGYNDGANVGHGGAVPASTGLTIETMTYSESGSLASFYSQGTANGTASVSSGDVNDGLTIGSLLSYTPYQSWTGNIAEVIVYNRVLSTAERQQVESYLKTKYKL